MKCRVEVQVGNAPVCPPSAVADQIIPWAEVREGDLVLWYGEFRRVEDICPLHGGEWLVRIDGEPAPGTMSCGTYAAVRRYQEG